jgi:hypothetical protein
MGGIFQTCRYERTSQSNRRMGKTKNQSGLLETMEENQDEISDAKGTRYGALESQGTSLQQKRILGENECYLKNLTHGRFMENCSA